MLRGNGEDYVKFWRGRYTNTEAKCVWVGISYESAFLTPVFEQKWTLYALRLI